MASTSLDFSIDSPTPGTRIGLAQGIRARGTAHVTNVGLPTFVIFKVEVQFGAGGQFFEADRTDPSWELFGEPAAINTVLTITARCHIRFLSDNSTSVSSATVQVIVGQIVPRVDIDPFDADVTVTTPPHIIPEVTGSITEPFTDVTDVRWQVDGGQLHPVDSAGGNRFRATGIPVDAGRHQLTFVATDPFGSSGSSTVDVLVRVPIDPGDVERVFSYPAYLGELLGAAQRYVSVDGATPGPSRADLEARLHQPLDGLTKKNAFAAANAGVSQTRLAVEVLRGVIDPTTTDDIDRQHRQLAYEVLLTELGTSATELRLARTAEEPQRAALAARLGLALAGPLPDALDRITFVTGTITDEQLAQVFGYRPTVPEPLDAPPPGAARLLLDKQAAARQRWRDLDTLDRDDPAAPQPIILPGLLTDADFVDPSPAAPAHQLFTERTDFHAARRELISDALADRTPAGFDAAVNTFIGTLDITALAARDQNGEDIGGDLRPLGLTKPVFRRLARLRALLASGELGDDEWAETVDILLSVDIRHEHTTWRQQEVERGIVLDPAVFTVRVDAPPVTPGWRETLAARTAELVVIGTTTSDAVAAAEAAVLPGLRDALITEIAANEPVEATAERLTRALAFDLRTQRDRRTTRVGQAIETMLDVLITARSGSYRPDLGVPVLQIAQENNFDLEFEWLVSYDRWLSAMRAFAYPENQLQPQLFVPENLGGELVLAPTAAYTGFMKALSKMADPTPDDVRLLARTEYLEQLPAGQRPGGIELTERLDNAALAVRQQLCVDAVAQGGGSTTEALIPQHIREIFWLVPVAVARKLQAAGHFVAALDWFQTVFAFHLPAGKRTIYHGLLLEQSISSDFGRLPEWLSQVRELNPHFTARKRRGAYTRATALSAAECFLDFADSTFAQNTADARARALALYQSARDLLDLDEVKPEEGETVPFPRNPLWQSLVSLAEIGLAKVHAGLDIAGQAAPVVATDNQNFLPSPYRFGVLIDRAKTLVGISQQVETAYLSALERLDGENYALLQAGRDLQIAAGSLAAQDLRVEVAGNGIALAGLQRERAQLQFDTFDAWIDGGLNDHEDRMLAALRVAEGLHALSALTQLGNTLKFWEAAGTLAGSFAEAAAAASTEAQIQQFKASFERRKQEWELNRGLAGKDVQIADAQIAGARLQLAVAQQERQVAADQFTHARAVAEFLATKFTNAELYDWMSTVLGKVYAFFLQQATALALLAQEQLAFERQEVVRGFVVADYWQPNGGRTGSSTDADRRGITGSARLLQDIVRLDQHAFETDRRKLHLSHTISVSQVAAFELEQLRETGVLTFATPQSLFDRDFPGHYLRLVRSVSVSVIALLPAGRGLRATMTASGVSRAVVFRDGFQTVPLQREPETIAMTAPINANGLFQLEGEGGLLRPFEGMGVDTVWQLQLPKPANPFDYSTIADVLLTIEYTALVDAEYREQVIRSLDRSFSGDRTFSVRDDFPDAWFDLNNPDTVDPPRRMRVTLPISRTDLPQHITGITVEHLTLFVVRADGFTAELTVPALTRTTNGQSTRAAQAETVNGIVSTRRPGGAAWTVFQDGPADGDWELQLEDTQQLRDWFTDDLIQDIVLVFTLAGTTPPWT